MINNGAELRDKGIKKALDNANNTHDKWSDKAYDFLLKYIKYQNQFMTEDVRVASEKAIPKPPSNRAWGSVILKAAKSGSVPRSSSS